MKENDPELTLPMDLTSDYGWKAFNDHLDAQPHLFFSISLHLGHINFHMVRNEFKETPIGLLHRIHRLLHRIGVMSVYNYCSRGNHSSTNATSNIFQAQRNCLNRSQPALLFFHFVTSWAHTIFHMVRDESARNNAVRKRYPLAKILPEFQGEADRMLSEVKVAQSTRTVIFPFCFTQGT